MVFVLCSLLKCFCYWCWWCVFYCMLWCIWVSCFVWCLGDGIGCWVVMFCCNCLGWELLRCGCCWCVWMFCVGLCVKRCCGCWYFLCGWCIWCCVKLGCYLWCSRVRARSSSGRDAGKSGIVMLYDVFDVLLGVLIRIVIVIVE